MSEIRQYIGLESANSASAQMSARLASAGMLVFLLFNAALRLHFIFNFNTTTKTISIAYMVLCLFVLFFPRFLNVFFLNLAFSFQFFGFQPYSIYSHVFEFLVTGISIVLAVMNLRKPQAPVNRHIIFLLACYILLSFLSLQMLPIGLGDIKNILLHGLNTPQGLYINSLTGVNRLMLFSILVFQLSGLNNARDIYKYIFIGLFAGGVFSSISGLADFYGLISLSWYRQADTPGVLHGFFLNRGWFAQFIMIASPFILIGFLTKNKALVWKMFLFAALVACEIALILSGARAGWVSYPLVLFFSWLFVHFFKGDENKLLQLKWREILKVFLYMPITVLISLFLIFQVLPYLSKLKNKADVQTAQKEAKTDSGILIIKERSLKITESGSRIPVWKDGINVGRENLLLGMGYDSFRWHSIILDKIPNSYFKKGNVSGVFETPHNTFVQLFVSGGLIGLCLWLLIISYSLMILTIDLVKNRNLLNIPVIISIIVSHIHGFFQDLQYIPMIWAITIIELGYVMTVSQNILQGSHRKKWDIIAAICVVVVLISGFAYHQKSSYEFLKAKYGIKVYKLE